MLDAVIWKLTQPFIFSVNNDGRDGGRNEFFDDEINFSREIILIAFHAPSTPTPNKHFVVFKYIYIYIYIYIYR